MLFLHETHAVIGEHEVTFEELVRHEYLGPVAEDPDARLLWYLDSTHGAGEGYKVVTITGFTDQAAYERHLDRVLTGDLAAWMRRADELRYALVGQLLVDAGAGHGDAVRLDAVPTDGQEHDHVLLRQDTVWPGGDEDLLAAVRERAGSGDGGVVRLERTFRPALGAAEPAAVVALHRIVDTDAWVAGWATEVSDWDGGIGPLPGAARRETRTLRTSRWSPLT